MIDELLEAAERANASECLCGAVTFVEEWVPRIVTELENSRGEIDLLKRKLALTESQLLEAEAKIEELKDAQ